MPRFDLLARVAALPNAHPLTRIAVVAAVVTAAAGIHRVIPLSLSLATPYFCAVVLAAWSLGRVAGILTAAVVTAAACMIETNSSLNFVVHGNAFWFRVMVMVSASLITSLVKAERERLRFESGHNALTGVMNRRAFERAATCTVESAHRYSRTLSVAFLDLDNFKRWNDVLGHAAGDRLLTTVGTLLNRTRKQDFVARLGGDEFVILMPETNAEGAKLVVERLRALLFDASLNRGMHATFTAGIVTFAKPPKNVNELLEMADAAMYNTKRRQKGTTGVVELPASAMMSVSPPAGHDRTPGSRPSIRPI